jgi:replicative DNA helicase
MAVPAAWIQPGFKRPIWGAVPPVTGVEATTVGRNEKKDQQVQVVQKDILLDMPDSSQRRVTVRDAGGDDELMNEAEGEGMGHLMDGIAPGSGMLFEMLKMAMEADAGCVAQKPPLSKSQRADVVAGYDEYDERVEDEEW